MGKAKKSTIEFLKKNVKDLSDYLPLNDDNRFDLIHLVEEEFVIPLSNALGEGKVVNEDLLHEADSVVDDLNIEDLDFKDFNNKIK